MDTHQLKTLLNDFEDNVSFDYNLKKKIGLI